MGKTTRYHLFLAWDETNPSADIMVAIQLDEFKRSASKYKVNESLSERCNAYFIDMDNIPDDIKLSGSTEGNPVTPPHIDVTQLQLRQIKAHQLRAKIKWDANMRPVIFCNTTSNRFLAPIFLSLASYFR